MKKQISTITLTVWISLSYGQFNDPMYFNNVYNQNTWSICISILEYNDSYYGLGITSDSIFYYKTIVFTRLNMSGELEIWNEFRVNNSDHYPGQPSSFYLTDDSTFVNGGTFGIESNYKGSLRLLDLVGDTIFTGTYLSKLGNSMIIDYCYPLDNNGFICTGQDHYVDAFSDVVLLRTDSLGNELWRKFYGWDTSDKGFKVLPTLNSGFIISGFSYMPGDDYNGDALLIKTDSLGNLEWLRKPGHPDFMDGYGSVTIAPDGNYVFGYTHAVSQGPPYPVPEAYRKIKFMKFNQNGDTIWERIYGSPYQINMLRNIITLHDGSFVAVGYANSDTITGPMQGWLFKINQYGDSIWYRDYRHYQESGTLDYLYDVYETSDHGLITCGQARLTNGGPDDVQRMWVLKLDSAGCAEAGCDPTIGIEEQGSGEAGWHGGMEVWPNPCSGVLSVKCLGLSAGRENELSIYDIFGREVEVIRIPGGQNEVQITVEDYPSGVYLAILNEGHSTLSRTKFIIAR